MRIWYEYVDLLAGVHTCGRHHNILPGTDASVLLHVVDAGSSVLLKGFDWCLRTQLVLLHSS
jgi:hypothetical protein